ncbi:hypothetical protein LTR84_003238 [Exophiala bonariae]|uniref:Thioesterase domain-containing protein n=1 Tax=Exophiala bonariae TaxID=1690606 RepID=A0AAV9N9F7_9EURO|nr:hypothetical protein LTR84_003238 [Exophiala bonariae]
MLSESQQEASFAITSCEEKEGRAHTKEASNGLYELDAATLLENAFKTSPAKHQFLTAHAHSLETRAVLKVSEQALPNHLTAHTLAGAGRISVAPYALIDDASGSLLAFYHLGTDLSGHTGLVHGGFLAVLLDECMGRACFPLLPEKLAVTAHIELDYKNPVKANTVIVIRAETERVEGRKAWVKGTVEAVGPNDGQVLVDCHALFIQPKWVAGMEQLV